MEQNKEKLKRKNLLVGWSMAVIALVYILQLFILTKLFN